MIYLVTVDVLGSVNAGWGLGCCSCTPAQNDAAAAAVANRLVMWLLSGDGDSWSGDMSRTPWCCGVSMAYVGTPVGSLC